MAVEWLQKAWDLQSATLEVGHIVTLEWLAVLSAHSQDEEVTEELKKLITQHFPNKFSQYS